eukprot:gene3919-4894_t
MSSETSSLNTKIEFDQFEEGISRIAKKQRTTLTKTIKDIDSILSSLNECKKQLNNPDAMETETKVPSAVSSLHQTLSESKFCLKIPAEHKELHAPISKLGKLVDKNFRSDIEKSTKDIEFDNKITNEIILQHLYRVGRFDVGDLFAKETNIDQSMAEETKLKFIDHHDILNSIEKKDLTPAINWCRHKRNELQKIDSYLEFKLHRLQFIHLLLVGKHSDALLYARSHLSEFSGTKMKEIQNLMGAFVYANRLSTSPYASMFDQTSISNQWKEIKTLFSKDSCALMGLPQESPLSITVTVGLKALPTFLKLSSFLVLKGANDDSLTVEIDVDPNYKFHSVFACPVSREQSTKNNPPVMLQCGHLLCRNSMQKLLKGSSTRFKCPYCPTEQSLVHEQSTTTGGRVLKRRKKTIEETSIHTSTTSTTKSTKFDFSISNTPPDASSSFYQLSNIIENNNNYHPIKNNRNSLPSPEPPPFFNHHSLTTKNHIHYQPLYNPFLKHLVLNQNHQLKSLSPFNNNHNDIRSINSNQTLPNRDRANPNDFSPLIHQQTPTTFSTTSTTTTSTTTTSTSRTISSSNHRNFVATSKVQVQPPDASANSYNDIDAEFLAPMEDAYASLSKTFSNDEEEEEEDE